MSMSLLARVNRRLSRRRRMVLVATLAAVAVVASTSLTDAAWTDDEWTQASVGVGSAGDCVSNDLFQTRAWGRQLTGMVAGISLDTIAGVEGVTLVNDGTTATPTPAVPHVTKIDDTTYIAKLPVSVLNGNVNLLAALGLGVPVGGVGAYTQWAQATNSGQAKGAAGLVSDQSGAIDVTGLAQGSATAPQAAHIHLGNLVSGALAGVSLDVGAVGASSGLDACAMVDDWPQAAVVPQVERDYGIAGLDLNASVPALGALSTGAGAIVGTVPSLLNALAGPGGSLTTGITNGVTAIVSPLLEGLRLGEVGTTMSLSAPDLTGVQALLTESMSDPDGVLTVDLGEGTIRVNLATLLGGSNGLNALEPNREVVLSAAIVTTLTGKLTVLLDSWKNRVLAAIETALRAVTLTSTTNLDLRLLGQPLTTLTVQVGPTSIGSLLDGTAALAHVEFGVLGQTPSPLTTAVLNALLSGVADAANGVVAGVVNTILFSPTGIVPALGNSLQLLITPVITALGNILTPFSALVSLRVNLQPDQPWLGGPKPADVTALPGEYKVTALRVGLINSADLLGLSLANASSGPAALRP